MKTARFSVKSADKLSQDEQRKPGQTELHEPEPPQPKRSKRIFKKLVQEFGKQYFGRNAAEDQRDAMENRELTYEGHGHFSVAERLFRINDQLE